MKKVSLILSSVVMTVLMVTSCNKKEGCTNPDATNYDASAEEDDGSCIFADTNDPNPSQSHLNPNLTYGSVTDIDGNSYATIQIGTQIWMAENLRTTKYCNGDPIPNITINAQWANLTTGAWSHYNNDNQNETPYGKLYNWYAVDDSRNICPCGWHVPTDAEYTFLTDYLGESVAGGKMKSTGTQYWEDPNTDATNESGFSGLPGGFRNFNGAFGDVGIYGNWWSSSAYDTSDAWYRSTNTFSGFMGRLNYDKGAGISVRCLRD